MNKRCLKVLPVLFLWTSCGPGKKQSSPGGPLALAPLVWIEASAQISLQEHLVLMPTLSRKSECVREGGTMAVTCQCHWPQKLQCFNPQKLQCFNCTNAVSHLDRPDSWTLRKQSLANTSDRLAKTYLPQRAGGRNLCDRGFGRNALTALEGIPLPHGVSTQLQPTRQHWFQQSLMVPNFPLQLKSWSH